MPQFGGKWTEEKLDKVRKYLKAYTTILNKQIDHRIERLEEKFERILECNIEIKQDLKWIKWHLEVDSE